MKKLAISVCFGPGLLVAALFTLFHLAPSVRAENAPHINPHPPPSHRPQLQGGSGVVRVSLTGTDVAGCGSAVAPCASVQYAINEAQPGDTVLILPGTWQENLTLSQPISLTGVSSASVVLEALPGQRVLTVTGAAIDRSVVISGLTFTGGDVSGGNLCFSGNTTNCGGGILLTDNARPIIQSVIIENNSAYRGGGLYANETEELMLDRIIFRQNSVLLTGGGLQAPNTPVTITNSLFQQNTTTHNVGGALATSANFGIIAPVLISNTTFFSNTAQCLGSICKAPAAYLFDQAARIVNSHFEGNSCSGTNCDGGGLHLSDSFNNPQFAVINTNFISNTAGRWGGGVYTTDKLFITGGRFERNVALSNFTSAFPNGGGGVYADSAVVSGTQFIQNRSEEDGGGIFARLDAAVTNAQFQSNQATANGGGIFAGSFVDDLSLTNTHFISNTATDGGGAYSQFSLALNGGRFEQNEALNNGGGLYASQSLSLTGGPEFVANVAQENGGGAYVAGDATLSGGSFTDNRAFGVSVFGAGGGGIFTLGDLTFAATTFSDNSATRQGGGAWVFGAANGIDGLFFQNQAENVGGGLMAFGPTTLTGTQLIANRVISTGNSFGGGGASIDDTTVLTNVLFQNNTSAGVFDSGGGLQTDALTATNTQFIGNSANSSGGGAAVFGPVNLSGVLFDGNSTSAASGGGLQATFDPIVLLNCTVINNVAGLNGGGLNSSGNIFITASLIDNNRTVNGNGGGLATSGSVTGSGNWVVSNNTAAADGGGIWANSRLTGTGGRIENNRSGDSGGGYHGQLGQLAVNGTTFANNQAGGDGGGAYAFDGSAVSHALFSGNTSKGAGGGLFLQRFAHITATQFLGNVARFGGGLAVSRPNTGTTPQFVHNSLFARNTATTSGAGLYWNQPRPINFIHNTLAAPNLTVGAAIHVVTGTVGITNNIIASHTTGIEAVGGAVTENFNLFSDNKFNTSGAVSSGGDSFDGEPAFQNPANDDYHLTAASKAIDQGKDAGVAQDFDGEPRPANSAFDLGYDELSFAAEPPTHYIYLPVILAGSE